MQGRSNLHSSETIPSDTIIIIIIVAIYYDNIIIILQQYIPTNKYNIVAIYYDGLMVKNQHTRELISAPKTAYKHDIRDLSHLRYL